MLKSGALKSLGFQTTTDVALLHLGRRPVRHLSELIVVAPRRVSHNQEACQRVELGYTLVSLVGRVRVYSSSTYFREASVRFNPPASRKSLHRL